MLGNGRHLILANRGFVSPETEGKYLYLSELLICAMKMVIVMD